MSTSVIVAIIVSVLLVEAVLFAGVRLVGLRGRKMVRALGCLHAIYGVAGVFVGALSLLWMWALP